MTTMKLTIQDEEGRRTSVPLVQDVISIGRDVANTIQLGDRNVSRHHARLFFEDGKLMLEDLSSYTGTRVNDSPVIGSHSVALGDRIAIGGYILSVEPGLQQEFTDPQVHTPPHGESTRPGARISSARSNHPSPAHGALPDSTDPRISDQLTSHWSRSEDKPTDPTANVRAMLPDSEPPKKSAQHIELSPSDSASTSSGVQSSNPGVTPTSNPPTHPSSAPSPEATPPSPDFMNAETAMSMPAVETARELRLSERPRLVCLSPPFNGVSFELLYNVVPFGRADEGNSLVIDHNSISRFHGWFQQDRGSWEVHDKQSANGIKVNGVQVSAAALRFGDMIDLGHLRFRFSSPDDMFVMGPVDLSETEPRRSNLPLYLALVVFAIIAGTVAAYLYSNMAPAKTNIKAQDLEHELTMCDLGRRFVSQSNWDEAIKSLLRARELQADCPDLESNLARARQEKQVQNKLVEAREALSARHFVLALEPLQAVPGDSQYALEARELEQKIRQDGSRFYRDEVEKLLEGSRFDDAKTSLATLAQLNPEHPALARLQQRIDNRQSSPPRARAKSEAGRERPDVQQAKAGPEPSSAEEMDPKERQAKTRELLKDAAARIQKEDYRGAIPKLHEALALKPAANYLGSIYKALGVSHAKLKEPEQAARYYRLYLKVRPDAPEKAEIEKILERYQDAQP